jgi:hypothetical protein
MDERAVALVELAEFGKARLCLEHEIERTVLMQNGVQELRGGMARGQAGDVLLRIVAGHDERGRISAFAKESEARRFTGP